MAADLKGVIAAALTPVTAANEVDLDRLAAHVARLHEAGCSFVSSFGTTGEGASLSTRQKVEALSGLARRGVDMRRQVPAVMTPVVDDAAAMLAGIVDAGCRAALILPPFYYPSEQAGFGLFLDAVFARFGGKPPIDFLLYNIPQLSGFAFSAALVEALVAKHGQRLAGIKDSTGDLDNGLMLVRSFPELAIFTGDDRVLPTLVRAGGAGMIGGIPNLFARDLVALYRAPEGAEAERLLARQAKRIAAIDGNGALRALKETLAEMTGDAAWRRLLPPLEPLSDAERRRLFAALEETGFALEAAR